MKITLDVIKSLRQQTGAGLMDVKRALEEAKGDTGKAKEIIKKKGKLVADKKSGRETREGWLGAYVHTNGKVGAMVQVFCETDFVARNEAFQALAKDLAMQITASNPQFVKPEEAPESFVKKETELAEESLAGDNKPEDIKKKIIAGKVAKACKAVSLMSQPCVKDPDKTVGDLIQENVTKLGENIEIGDFARFDI